MIAIMGSETMDMYKVFFNKFEKEKWNRII